MAGQFERSPILMTRVLFVGLLAVLAAVVMTGCSTLTNTPSSESGPIESALDESLAELDCFVRATPLEDCDGDGVSNLADIVPFRDDQGDDDGDLVLNRDDRWPNENDQLKDTDADGVADYLDTFFGDNYGDVDGDGWANSIDPQPYISPPLLDAVAPPQTGMTQAELELLLIQEQNRRKFISDVYGPSSDGDYDGIPDDADFSPTPFTNDRDGDGDPDFYDPRPGDYYTDSSNDPYDPRNDEYWVD